MRDPLRKGKQYCDMAPAAGLGEGALQGSVWYEMLSLHLEVAPCHVTRRPGKRQPLQTQPPQSTERQLRILAGRHHGSELRPASQAGPSEGGKRRGRAGEGRFPSPAR